MILWEWVDARGKEGAISGASLDHAQQAKLDERLDRIEELERLDHGSIAGYIWPFAHELKKMKIQGSVALRPILVLGPFDKNHEVTFLLLAKEENRRLVPSKEAVVQAARARLEEILANCSRRRRYERD